MEFENSEYILGAGGLISFLLSTIAYLLKFMLQDFRSLQKDFQDVKTKYHLLEGAIKTMSKELNALRLQLEKRS